MKTKAKKLPKSQVLLTIELEEAEWKKYRDQATRKLSHEVKIDGFRAGHVPENILLEKFGEGPIIAETIDLAVPQAYMDAIREEKVQPIARPDVKITSEKPFVFEAIVAVYPEITIKPITKLKVEKEKIEVTEKEIDEMVKYFQEQIAERKEVDRAAKKGDIVITDFAGFDIDGVKLDGTESKQHPIEIGSGTMIPGFEDEILGLKKGDSKTFEITFPKKYHSEKFAGKKVKFEVHIHHVQEKILPEMSEAFVKNITGQEKPVEEFRKEIEESLKERKKTEEQKKHEEALLEAVVDVTNVDLPEILIHEEVDYLLDNVKFQVLQRGMTWEAHLMHLKKSEDEIRKELHSQAEKQVKARMGIQEFLERDGVKIDEKEIEEEVMKVFSRMSESDRAQKAEHFQKGARGWKEAENKLRITKWVDGKLAELIK
ncbi:trigger factor [Candidatus Peregrinibacteria bacterium]|nr:trigger factor [Candidatus Peregrinibacteria bacterium]